MRHPFIKRQLTLIELLVCLVLIVMVAGVLVVRARAMIDRYRFDKGIEKLVRQLNLTKQLALASDNDVTLKLKLKEGKLRCTRRSPIESDHKKVFYFSIEPIAHFCLDGKEQQEWACEVMANGWLKEEGMIHLSYKNKYNGFIDLRETPFFQRGQKPSENLCHR
ncbi:MAG: hypothetical protein AAF443_00540 [Chlamydiota bacterium]